MLPRTEADPTSRTIPVVDRPRFNQERIGIRSGRRGWRAGPGCRVGQAWTVRSARRQRFIRRLPTPAGRAEANQPAVPTAGSWSDPSALQASSRLEDQLERELIRPHLAGASDNAEIP